MSSNNKWWTISTPLDLVGDKARGEGERLLEQRRYAFLIVNVVDGVGKERCH